MDVVNKAFCPCCYENFDAEETIPKILICGHSVCLLCAAKLVDDGIIRCIICRRPTDLPGNNAQHLNNNFSLIDTLTASGSAQYECHLCNARTSDPDSVQLCRECCSSAGLTVDIEEANVPKLSKKLICCKCFLVHHFGERQHTRISFLNYVLIQQYKEMAELVPEEENIRKLATKMNDVISHLDHVRESLSSMYDRKKHLKSLDTLVDLKKFLANNNESYSCLVDSLQKTTTELSAEVENLSFKLLKSVESSGGIPPDQQPSTSQEATTHPNRWLPTENVIRVGSTIVKLGRIFVRSWSLILKLIKICIWLAAFKMFFTVGRFFIADPSFLVFLLTVIIFLLSPVIFS